MIVRLAATMFVLGSALGVGAMYMSEQWRNARAAARADTAELPRSELPSSSREVAARELGAADLGELPNDLALDEIYDRVSFAS